MNFASQVKLLTLFLFLFMEFVFAVLYVCVFFLIKPFIIPYIRNGFPLGSIIV